jgi:hypothetical protein
MAIATYRLKFRPRARTAEEPRRSGVVPRMPAYRPHYRGGSDAVTFTGPGFPKASDTTVDNGGDPILMHAEVALIFYGSAWHDGSLSPTAGQVQGAIQKVLKSNYFDGLGCYSCTGADMDTDWNRIILDDPPDSFGAGDAHGVVSDLIDNVYANFPPNNRPTFYAVFLPPSSSISDSGVNGEHTNSGPVYYSFQNFGSLDFITRVFTHELVEALTDPNGGGWQVLPRSAWSWNEICDICKNASASVDGVDCAAYYSIYYGACVVPQPDPPPPPPPRLANGEHRITCATFAYHRGHRYIAIIGGPGHDKPWVMLVDHAIERVRSGELSFWTRAGGERADVHVGVSETNNAFLTTSPDGTTRNNLDVLAETHPCDLDDQGVFWL